MMGTCKHSIMQTENLAIMGELAALFDRETPKSRSSGEASYPALNTGGPLEEPRRASGLGKCQLNELLIYTPYFHLYPEYYMDRRIGRSSGHQHITTSAPAQDRPPPLPPLAPPTRRGRSSDEHAGTATASASDRNRTGSPIARHRPSEMHIMQNKWIGHTAELRRANREPTEYISQADWDAIRDYRAFKSAAPETTASSPPANDAASAVSETTASAVELTTPRSSATTASSPPANDAASAVSETTASAVDLTTPQEWAENYCRRPLEPFVFGVFFDTHNVSDREVRMRETVVGLRSCGGLTTPAWKRSLASTCRKLQSVHSRGPCLGAGHGENSGFIIASRVRGEPGKGSSSVRSAVWSQEEFPREQQSNRSLRY
eukprot:s3594_g11.t4